MKIPEQNSPVRPPREIQPHHIRHAISGTLVFLMGIAANEMIVLLRKSHPKTVLWNGGEVQKNYTQPTGMPPAGVQVEIGAAEDGSIVWRVRK